MNKNLDKIKQVDINKDEAKKLVDIQDIEINESLSCEERVMNFIKQIGNPYCFKCDDITIKISFSESNVSLEERLESLLLSV